MGQMLKDIAGETSTSLFSLVQQTQAFTEFVSIGAVRPSKGEWENGLRIDVETQAVTHNLELEERKSKARPRPGLENRLVEAKKYLENGSIKEQGRDGSDASSTPTGSIEEKSGFRGVTFARD